MVLGQGFAVIGREDHVRLIHSPRSISPCRSSLKFRSADRTQAS